MTSQKRERTVSVLAKALDKNGNDTKKGYTLDQIHSSSDLLCESCHVWIYDPSGWVLLQQRSKDNQNHPAKWDISAAGHVDFGETPEQAAIRETKEEINLTVKPSDLEFATRKYTENISMPSNFLHNQFTSFYFLKADKKSMKTALLDGEVADLEWKRIDDFEREVHDPHLSKDYVPHNAAYYDMVIAELRKRSEV